MKRLRTRKETEKLNKGFNNNWENLISENAVKKLRKNFIMR